VERREATLRRTATGLVPQDDGWFVVNARDAAWKDGDFGAYTRFEGDARFPSIGINLNVLPPGQASCMYHGEDEQEDFLVLAGECLLLVEDEERRLHAWDFFHCPAWTRHVLVGAGDASCLVLAVGTRSGGDVVYPAAPLARRHRACVERETPDPKEAYASFADDVDTPCRPEWLPR
jgi:uncharacterized cupin superfamily protein